MLSPSWSSCLSRGHIPVTFPLFAQLVNRITETSRLCSHDVWRQWPRSVTIWVSCYTSQSLNQHQIRPNSIKYNDESRVQNISQIIQSMIRRSSGAADWETSRLTTTGWPNFYCQETRLSYKQKLISIPSNSCLGPLWWYLGCLGMECNALIGFLHSSRILTSRGPHQGQIK